MEALNLQADIPPTLNESFKDQCLLLSDLTSMQDATENLIFPDLIGEPRRLQLNSICLLKLTTELIILSERLPWVAIEQCGVFGNVFYSWWRWSPSNTQWYPSVQVSVQRISPINIYSNSSLWLFCHYIYGTQRYAGLHWLFRLNACQCLFFANTLGREM